MPMWRILDLMPNQPSFDLAAAAMKVQYEKQMKSLQDVLDGNEMFETSGRSCVFSLMENKL